MRCPRRSARNSIFFPHGKIHTHPALHPDFPGFIRNRIVQDYGDLILGKQPLYSSFHFVDQRRMRRFGRPLAGDQEQRPAGAGA